MSHVSLCVCPGWGLLTMWSMPWDGTGDQSGWSLSKHYIFITNLLSTSYGRARPEIIFQLIRVSRNCNVELQFLGQTVVWPMVSNGEGWCWSRLVWSLSSPVAGGTSATGHSSHIRERDIVITDQPHNQNNNLQPPPVVSYLKHNWSEMISKI